MIGYIQSLKKQLIIFFIAIFILTACVGQSLAAETNNEQVSSSTPTCVPYNEISTPGDWEIKKTLYIILFDPFLTSETPIEYQDGSVAKNAYEFVEALSTKLLNAGSQVSVFKLGFRTYENARYLRLVSNLEIPPLYNTPALSSTFTPIPVVIETDLNDRGIIAATNAAAKTQTSVAITSTSVYYNYLCDIKNWNDTIGSTATHFKNMEDQELASVATEIVKSNSVIPNETPYSNDVVFEGLYHATLDLKDSCPGYDECVLIIVDDLKTWTVENMLCKDCNIDLSSLDKILVVMPNCRDINQPTCKAVQEFWNGQFIEYGYRFPSADYNNGVKAESFIFERIGD